MELTKEKKDHIDSLSYHTLLAGWRFTPPGDPMFQGATGDYWAKRMEEKKQLEPNPAQVSKDIGWDS